MKVAYINYYFDEDISLETYFLRYPSIHGWCKALANTGINVTVYQRFNRNLNFSKDNVSYRLVKDNNTCNLSLHKNPATFHNQILKNEFDIIHINSFNYAFQVFLLKIKSKDFRIVIQHHAEKPWKGFRKYFQKFFLRYIDGVIFSSNDIFIEWTNTGVMNYQIMSAEIVENSTDFVAVNKIIAREKTGLKGNPVFLWVGRLNDNKDPLTVISGFKILLNEYPDAKLYMIYSEVILEMKIIEHINSSKYLKESVKLLRKIDHSLLNDYYNSADYFVLGSHTEGSGYSLIEAMACGVIPIVTSIPSFRTITRNGAFGALWKPGDINSFYETTKNVLLRNKEELSKGNIDIFNSNLSFGVIASKAKEFYEQFPKN